jgi:hypothetical protein
MTDTPAPGASSLTDAPADKFPVTDQQTRTRAYEILSRARADQDYRAKYLAGNKEVQAEVHAAELAVRSSTHLEINGVPVKLPGGEQPEARAAELGGLQRFIDVPAAVADMLRRGDPVSAAEQKWAKQQMELHKADEEWARRYLAKGKTEMQQMFLWNTILTSPTKK